MKPTVIIADCPDYDVARIARIIGEGLDRLELTPSGRTLIKPNVVTGGPKFPHAHTRPEFVEGVIAGLRSRAQGMDELRVGERSGITVPTRYAYQEAGFLEMFERAGVQGVCFEDDTQVEIPLYHPDRLRDSIFTPQTVAEADFFVNCPKFKAHPWTTVTFSMKNYIGIQDDRHRLIDHDHKLNEKVADLQYVIQPQFIAIDAIIAGEGRMLTPIPFDLGLVIMGNNQVAFDAVCCHIIGIDPLSVDHIRLAHERGFGPIDLDRIEIAGLSLAEAKRRARGFRSGLIRVEDYFADTNIRAYAGPPPSDDVDYCWGGCPGAMEEAIEIMRLFDEGTDSKMPPTHIVFGRYDGAIAAERGEKVIFIGDCAEFRGHIAGQRVEIESRYVDRSTRSPHEVQHDDIFAKMGGAYWEWYRRGGNADVIRMGGCPVSVVEQVLLLINAGKLNNPYFDAENTLPFTSCYLSWRTRQLVGKVFGGVYQRSGPAERGAARPHQNLPPPDVETPLEASSADTERP